MRSHSPLNHDARLSMSDDANIHDDDSTMLDARIEFDPSGDYSPADVDDDDADDEAFHAHMETSLVADDADSVRFDSGHSKLAQRIRSGERNQPSATGFDGGTATDQSSHSPSPYSPPIQEPSPVASPRSAEQGSEPAPIFASTLEHLNNTPQWREKFAAIDTTHAVVLVVEYADPTTNEEDKRWREMPLSAFAPDLLESVKRRARAECVEVTIAENSTTSARFAFMNEASARVDQNATPREGVGSPTEAAAHFATPQHQRPRLGESPTFAGVQQSSPQTLQSEGAHGMQAAASNGNPDTTTMMAMMLQSIQQSAQKQAETQAALLTQVSEGINALRSELHAPRNQPVDDDADFMGRLSRKAYQSFVENLFTSATSQTSFQAPDLGAQVDSILGAIDKVGEVRNKLASIAQTEDEGFSISDALQLLPHLQALKNGGAAAPAIKAAASAAPAVTVEPGSRLMGKIAAAQGA